MVPAPALKVAGDNLAHNSALMTKSGFNAISSVASNAPLSALRADVAKYRRRRR